MSVPSTHLEPQHRPWWCPPSAYTASIIGEMSAFTCSRTAWNVRHAIVLREQKRTERDSFFFLFGEQGEYVGRREVVA